MKTKRKPSAYNGDKSWKTWSISMEFSNDYGLYQKTCRLVEEFGISCAAAFLCEELAGQTTADGAVFNKTAICLALCDWR
ncbi:hypothetical protein EDD52_11513 [Primorskyibacter sedentarius]|uniref:Uncharacterized protein n=1 Tax=Primorskyibacter sedentarius TaxID=745311 RepID=A0A4R3J5U8_9RHOB|nr:hypothetical protein [Primorskyibacter sedentarius]TCS60196.1 hypothetical protein EDD52_11513 [Primorskyibacter sedentarius]